ncbi:MAG: PP2C family protein-serine/threonine phosphatase [Frankia sp.]
MTLRLHYALRSDVGHVREGNEDSAYAGSRLIAVADGMGGHAAGEVASSTVIGLLAHLDEDVAGGNLPDALAEALREANARLREMTSRDGSLDGMGTTITAVLSSGSRLGVLHVGDSRAYLLRDDEMVQITHDHTLVQDLVDQGRITADQAGSHPQRSLLMRALDGRDVEPDVSVREARRGDRYMLCTDGLSGVVSDETIFDTLLLPTPQEAVDRLVDLALKGGGPDNVTVVVADVVDDGAAYTDRPLVGGAAAEKGVVAGALAASDGTSTGELGTSAARAAHYRRQANLADTDPHGELAADFESDLDAGPSPERSRRSSNRRRRKIALVAGVVVVLVAAGAVAGWAYLRTQYYVGVDHDQVAVFQGVDTSLAGVSLSSVRKRYMPLAQLPEFAQPQVREGIPADSRADAEKIISNLAANGATTAPTPTPTPTPTPKPSPTIGTPAKATAVPKKTTAAALPCLAMTAAGTARLPGCVTTTIR